jgi:hypothetical protein
VNQLRNYSGTITMEIIDAFIYLFSPGIGRLAEQWALGSAPKASGSRCAPVLVHPESLELQMSSLGKFLRTYGWTLNA